MKKILIISPHADDETLGAGGYLLKLHMAHPNGRVCGAKRPKCEAERSHHL